MGQSLGSIMGRCFICRQEVILPTTCAFVSVAESFLVLPIISFPRSCMQRNCPEEGGHTPPPPILDYLMARYFIHFVAEEKFALIYITVVKNEQLLQNLGKGLSRMWTRTEWGIWVDESLGGKWDVTLSFFCIVSFVCSTPGITTE